MTENSPQPTYHGVEIPDDIWLSWEDPNSSEVSGFQRGVCAALRITDEADDQERDRLEPLAQERYDEEQRAWKAKYDRDMADHRARAEGAEGTDG